MTVGSRAALIDDSGDRWTSRGLTAAVGAAADRLAELGVGPGCRVILQGRNSAEYVVSALALMHAGASVVPVDPGHRAEETSELARACGARLWLGDDGAAGSPGSGGNASPAWKRVGVRELVAGAGRGAGGRHRALDRNLELWRGRPDAAILMSSGTTGSPKGVVRSGRSLVLNTECTARVMGFTEREVMSPLLPFSHQYGLSVILLWWMTGSTLLVSPHQRPDLGLELAARYGATAVDASPATYHTLLRIARQRPQLMSRLAGVRAWGVGGAPLSDPLARRFRDRFGRALLDGYGMSELGNISLATPENAVGCGRPLPGFDVRVVPVPDSGPGSALGEVLVRAPEMIMTGYLRLDGTLETVERGGWYRTRDLGYLDQSGNLHVVGRLHAVHRLGYTVYPEYLERKAEACGREVKVLAAEDLRRGAALHFVVCDPERRGAAEWAGRLAQVLAEFEQPNQVHVVEDFPRNANGKVDTGALRRLVLGAT